MHNVQSFLPYHRNTKSISFAEMGGEEVTGVIVLRKSSQSRSQKWKAIQNFHIQRRWKKSWVKTKGLEQRYDEGLPTVRAKISSIIKLI